MSKVRNVFITGANRGIGLNLVKQMTSVLKPEKIFATYRDPSKSQELLELAAGNSAIHPIQLDIRTLANIDNIVKTVDEVTNSTGLNLLINNAGVSSKYARLNATKKEHLMENLEVNTVAPILLTKAFIALLEKASASSSSPPGIGKAVVVNMSSILGSISLTDNGGMYAYKCSKSALNMATKIMSLDFSKSKIIAVAIHPGWVKTAMGGDRAPLTPLQSVQGIVKLLESLNESNNGQFIQYDGEQLKW